MPVSARVSHVLAVVAIVRDSQPKSLADVTRTRIDAIRSVAAREGRHDTTVCAACSTQLGRFTIYQFDQLIWQWYDYGDDELRRLLFTYAASGHQAADGSAIDAFFGAPHQLNGSHEAAALVAELARGGQGQSLSPKARKAVEDYAMWLATDFLESSDWDVENVSRCQSYDLRCTKPSGEELRVVVKGTTSDGSAVLLTPLEVRHARSLPIRVGLFVARNLTCSESPDGSITVGEECWDFCLIHPWEVRDEGLIPLGFEYRVPLSAH